MSRFRDLFENKEVREEVFTAPPAQELTPPPAPETIKEEVFEAAEPAAEVTEPEAEAAPEPKTFGM